jgi:hypothetical protein
MANIVVAAIAKWNGSALVKGEKQLTKFQKTTLSLGKAFATTFAAKQVYNYGRAAVVAFAEAEAQQQRLTKLLRVTVGATDGQVIALNHQAEALEKLGVVTAGSITQVQSQLATFNLQTSTIKALTPAILDYVTAEKGAAASASEFKSMTNGLAQALNGNFASLTKTGFVLDDVTKDLIKNGSEADRAAALVKVLDSTYKGFNASLRKTTSGQLVALNNAADKAKETIGKGLVDSIALLGGSDGIQTATDNMENFGKATADTLFLFASLVKTFNETNLSKLFGLSVFAQINKLAQIGSQLRGEAAGQSVAYSPTSMYFTNETAERAKLVSTIKKQNTTEKEKQKLSAAELREKKKQAELDELKKKFDVDRINLETALANSTDEAEKARIKSLLTIIDEDENAAAKRLAELDKANAAKMQAEYFAAISLNNLAEAARLAAMGVKTITLGGAPIGSFQSRVSDPNTGIADPLLAQAVSIEADIAAQFAEEAAKIAEQVAANSERVLDEYITTITGLRTQVPGSTMGGVNNFTINTPLGSEEYLTIAVQQVIQKLNRMGDDLSYAGALR